MNPCADGPNLPRRRQRPPEQLFPRVLRVKTWHRRRQFISQIWASRHCLREDPARSAAGLPRCPSSVTPRITTRIDGREIVAGHDANISISSPGSPHAASTSSDPGRFRWRRKRHDAALRSINCARVRKVVPIDRQAGAGQIRRARYEARPCFRTCSSNPIATTLRMHSARPIVPIFMKFAVRLGGATIAKPHLRRIRLQLFRDLVELLPARSACVPCPRGPHAGFS